MAQASKGTLDFPHQCKKESRFALTSTILLVQDSPQSYSERSVHSCINPTLNRAGSRHWWLEHRYLVTLLPANELKVTLTYTEVSQFCMLNMENLKESWVLFSETLLLLFLCLRNLKCCFHDPKSEHFSPSKTDKHGQIMSLDKRWVVSWLHHN